MVTSFLNSGWDVAFSYNNAKEDALFLEKAGKGRCAAFQCDFADPDAVNKLAGKLKSNFGAPDVLINNAGISSYGLFQDLSEDDLDLLFRINFKSMYRLCAHFASDMIAGGGRIINVASMWGERGASCEAAYSASKAAVIGFTRALAKELAPSGIPVNAISPGVVDTEMMDRFSEEEKRALRDEIPAGRFAEPEEIARIALFLASDAPIYLTGQIIGVDGGYY